MPSASCSASPPRARARWRLAEAHGCRFAAEPPHGLFGWLDTGVDTERLAHAMLDDWLLAPGALFHAAHRPSTLMRINFATSQDARFWKALAQDAGAPVRIRSSQRTRL